MKDIKDIVKDYEILVKLDIQIPLDNGDVIKFTFQPQNLPHLLGLQHLVDIPVLFEYSEKRLSAKKVYEKLCSDGDDALDMDILKTSQYFEDLYNDRIKYFSSDRILDILGAKQIIRFDAKKIKKFETKLSEVDYLFWKRYKDDNNRVGYFGIGFMATGSANDKNFPYTFFFRIDDDYICNQEVVCPISIKQKFKDGRCIFNVYKDHLLSSLKGNNHYRELRKVFEKQDSLDWDKIKECDDENVQRHFELLKLDALNKIYLPYMDKDFRWTNDEKRFVLEKIENREGVLPGEIKNILNEYKYKKKQ